MIVLLTNDDGIDSPGLHALAEALEPRHTVYVSVPNRDRSGISHALSLNDPMRIKRIRERVYACSGYPVDCVLTGLKGALPQIPDCVLSGINLGPNIGTDLLYSGTAAAARQASIMGKPGMAISVTSFHPPFHFEPAVRFVVDYLEKIVSCWVPGLFLNVNVPNSASSVLPMTCTTLAELNYRTEIETFALSETESYHFLKAHMENAEPVPGTDLDAVSRGMISITAVKNYPKFDKLCVEYMHLFTEKKEAPCSE